jgi:hypothetical protein
MIWLYMSVLPGARKSSILDSASRLLSPLAFWKRSVDISDLILTPQKAIEELERRQKDPALRKKVEEFLKGDVPEYFKDGPILYIARHAATPNFETLRFINLIKHLGLRTVITQDSKGLFVSQNLVKRALGKLPICRRVTQKGKKINEHYENVTIIDFNGADGKALSEIKTLWGEGLIDFHKRLFSELNIEHVEIPDDAEWLDRHHRGRLLEHYKHLLALFVAHGIFFENYNTSDPEEIEFIKTVLRPACEFVEKKFGYKPLIVQIFPTTPESYRFWISYPTGIVKAVQESLQRIRIQT